MGSSIPLELFFMALVVNKPTNSGATGLNNGTDSLT